MRLTKSHLKEVAWIAAGQAATVVGGIAGIKVLTSLLAPGQYGMFSLALTLAVFSQQVWAGPLQQAINRYVAPYLQTLRLPELIATGTFVYLRIALVQAILLLCGIVAAGALFHLDKDLQHALLLGVLLAAVQPLFELPQGIYVQLRQRGRVAVYQGVSALARPLIAAALVLTLGANAVWAMLGTLIATLVLAAVQGRNMMVLGSGGIHSRELGWSLIRFAAPYVTWGTLSWGVAAGDRWILGMTTTTEVVGLYVVAFQIGTILPRLAGQLVSSFVVPILNEMAGVGAELHKVKQALFLNAIVMLGVGALGVIGALWMSVFGRDLMVLLTGPGYDKVAFALPWFFAGGVIYEMAFLCFGVGPLLYRPQAFMVGRMMAYGVTLCLMGLLTLHWGLTGMVAAYFIGALMHLAATAYIALKLYKEVLGRGASEGD